mmetsp:Transcript_45938/g.147616  ORF Transcript_45938/g.147616 Transcript_45938/m.147616 type:complete len:213 (-) Transcript_45938:1877-2515(-)
MAANTASLPFHNGGPNVPSRVWTMARCRSAAIACSRASLNSWLSWSPHCEAAKTTALQPNSSAHMNSLITSAPAMFRKAAKAMTRNLEAVRSLSSPGAAAAARSTERTAMSFHMSSRSMASVVRFFKMHSAHIRAFVSSGLQRCTASRTAARVPSTSFHIGALLPASTDRACIARKAQRLVSASMPSATRAARNRTIRAVASSHTIVAMLGS